MTLHHDYELNRDGVFYDLELELEVENGIGGDEIHAPEPPQVSIFRCKHQKQPFFLTFDEEKRIEEELTEMLIQGEL